MWSKIGVNNLLPLACNITSLLLRKSMYCARIWVTPLPLGWVSTNQCPLAWFDSEHTLLGTICVKHPSRQWNRCVCIFMEMFCSIWWNHCHPLKRKKSTICNNILQHPDLVLSTHECWVWKSGQAIFQGISYCNAMFKPGRLFDMLASFSLSEINP